MSLSRFESHILNANSNDFVSISMSSSQIAMERVVISGLGRNLEFSESVDWRSNEIGAPPKYDVRF